MDDSAFESQWGARFSAPIQTNLGPTHLCVRGNQASFGGGEVAVVWR